MYYFTILVGQSQRSLIQYFQKTHAYQLETIPGIKDMIAKFVALLKELFLENNPYIKQAIASIARLT